MSEEKKTESNEEAKIYWEALKIKEENEKPIFTDKGKILLKYMQDNPNELGWKSKDLSEEVLISSRGVSGAMQKLVSDGYVEKIGQNPIIYILTEKGKVVEII